MSYPKGMQTYPSLPARLRTEPGSVGELSLPPKFAPGMTQLLHSSFTFLSTDIFASRGQEDILVLRSPRLGTRVVIIKHMLILASGSPARAAMLAASGLTVEVVVPRLDEADIKRALLAEEAPARDVADALAETKAVSISRRRPGAFVIGADQVLAHSGRTFDKPRDVEEARKHLQVLRGRCHRLLSAAVVAQDGRVIWRHIGLARLSMRDFSDAFLNEYLTRHGDTLLETVGAYKVEAGGAVLFDRIEGDWFTILGLPLLELLAFLRLHGLCRT
jgi:septum formation protein